MDCARILKDILTKYIYLSCMVTMKCFVAVAVAYLSIYKKASENLVTRKPSMVTMWTKHHQRLRY